ncbi:hypothetical protein XHC_2670 [Xanthomonas hortorum pv. carotae str. M081]|nr:hypothetical protein XHC_2670 [Xanthomonas hortorum pv. carotae str. M081]
MPAEGFQRLRHEFLRLRRLQPAVTLMLLDQLQHAGGEDLPLLQDLLGLRTQRGIFDQLQPQQRGEHAKRIGRQRRIVDRAERGGMYRHAGHRQVVIAHRMHAHHRKQPAQRGQFLRRADPDRTVSFQIQPRPLVVALQARGQRGIGAQGVGVDLRHQRHQVAVQRHLGAIHVRHRLGEQAADVIGRDKHGIAHGLVLAEPANASVTAFSPTAPCGDQLHGSMRANALACRQSRGMHTAYALPRQSV